MAPYNVRGGTAPVNRMRGFKTNRSPGCSIRSRLSGLRSAGFLGDRSRDLYNNPSARPYTDARQVLQQKKAGHRLGSGITDLSQKLVSRTVSSGRLNEPGSRFGKPLPVARLDRNVATSLLAKDRFQSKRTAQNRPDFGIKRLAQNKLIQVHRGGITVTAKQNLTQRRQWKPVQDELEEMTLADLPQMRVTSSRTFGQSAEARLLQSTPKESNTAAATVLITNLKQTVTEEDINELFGIVGRMTSAELLHPGTALVTYVRKEDATTALEYYNNVTLDGMAMRCTILSLDKQKSKLSISSRLGERTHSPRSESFLSPASRSASFLSPIPRTNIPDSRLRSTSRQIQTQTPLRTQRKTKATNNPKFTVCLN